MIPPRRRIAMPPPPMLSVTSDPPWNVPGQRCSLRPPTHGRLMLARQDHLSFFGGKQEAAVT